MASARVNRNLAELWQGCRLPRLRGDEGGAALVELALIIPFLFITYMGIAELASAFAIKQRLAQVDLNLGDLIGRSTTLSANQIDDVFAAADLLMAPYPTSALSITATAVELDASGNSQLIWQRRNRDSATTPTVPEVPATFGVDRQVIVIETSYEYSSLFLAGEPLTLESSGYLLPRSADLSTWNGEGGWDGTSSGGSSGATGGASAGSADSASAAPSESAPPTSTDTTSASGKTAAVAPAHRSGVT